MREYDEQYREKAHSFDDLRLNIFASKMCSDIIKDAKDSENICCSPISFYLALASIALGTKGRTEEQIMHVLATSEEELISDCRLLVDCFHDDSSDDEEADNSTDKRISLNENSARLSVMNGLWADKSNGYSFKKSYVDEISDILHVDCFDADFSVPSEVEDEIRRWAEDNTDGFLSPNVSISSDASLVLSNLLHFKGIWADEFSEDDTKEDIFHTDNGDVKTMFMHSNDDGYAYIGDGFVAASRSLGSRKMVFFLPDEGTSIEELTDNPKKIFHMLSMRNRTMMDISWSLPKFDLSSNENLKSIARAMGMEALFESSDDFSDMIKGPNSDKCRISNIEQQTRLSVDEKGCEASSVTYASFCCFGMLPQYEKLELNLNRPFAFAIYETIWDSYADDDKYKEKNIPIFFGIVNDPTT